MPRLFLFLLWHANGACQSQSERHPLIVSNSSPLEVCATSVHFLKPLNFARNQLDDKRNHCQCGYGISRWCGCLPGGQQAAYISLGKYKPSVVFKFIDRKTWCALQKPVCFENSVHSLKPEAFSSLPPTRALPRPSSVHPSLPPSFTLSLH